ncbi:uncharacterized protein [Dasypus novemcinctus]|uniref:uncharacterized protein isoform X2 n=1 Tax=Dasypus novemcinctus TaxID=9361 RepID=UPI000328C811|nr:low affinity immunoglobulin gamma Fc region receptor III-B isoform X2 [Dasypus novemcinctus]
MWQLLPPTALLLLVAAGLQTDLPKAVVLLDPPWDRVLKDDSVTLRCQGTYPPGDNSTQWLLNGNLISNQDPSYLITEAIPENSGEYRCQTKLSTLSDPVQLRVHAGGLSGLRMSLRRVWTSLFKVQQFHLSQCSLHRGTKLLSACSWESCLLWTRACIYRCRDTFEAQWGDWRTTKPNEARVFRTNEPLPRGVIGAVAAASLSLSLESQPYQPNSHLCEQQGKYTSEHGLRALHPAPLFSLSLQ